MPSGEPTSQPTGIPTAIPTSVPTRMPYTITNLTTVPMRTSIKIDFQLSEASLFQCGVYKSTASSPASLFAIVNQGHVISSPTESGSLTINGLVASTEYKLFCLTKTSEGVLTTSYMRMMEHEKSFTTLCCRHITIDLAIKDVSSEQATLGVLNINWDALPASNIYVNLTTNYRENSTQPFIGEEEPFKPSTFKFKSSLKANSFSAGVPAKSTPGQYFLDFNMNSWDSVEMAKYEVVYTTTNPKLTVIDKYEPPTPNVTQSYFSDDGIIVYIYFDSATNVGGQGFGLFTCSSIVNFPGASTSNCIWESRSLLQVYSDIDSPLKVGDTINLVANTIKAKCTNTIAACEEWAYSTATVYYTIETALDAVVPAPNIDAAAAIGSCDNFVLDLSLATGSGGRDWTVMNITVTSPNNYDVSALQGFFNDVYEQSPPTPAGIQYFELGGIYEIDVSVCNFLGKCSLSGLYSHTVEYEPVTRPIAYILGEAQTLNAKNLLVVKCVAYVEQCSGDMYNSDFYIANAQSTANLEYSWTILKDGVEDASLAEYTGVTSVPEIWLPSYSLVVDSVYLVQMSVKYTVTNLSTTDTLDVFVRTDDITAVINGGQDITLPMGTSTILDASLSVDGDINPTVATGASAGLSFEWTCFLSEPLDTEDCGVTMEFPAMGTDFLQITPIDTLNATYMNTTSTITVTVFDDSDRRPSSRDIVVTIVPGDAPVITLSTDATKILPSHKLKLLSSVQLQSSAQMTWTVDSPTVSLDLQELSLTDVSRVAPKGTHQFNLVLQESTLPVRGVLTFVLQAGTSSASIDITMISPPVPGRLVVSPDEGLEMSTKFDIGTSLWTDIELPISYAFGYITNEGTFLAMQSRSEDTYAIMTMPAGVKEHAYAKVVFVTAFNPLEASESLTTGVVVAKQEVTAEELTDIITEQLTSAVGETDSNVVKQIVNVASSSMNNVNCSLAPNCSSLLRGPCFKAAHTCGECLPSFIGEKGHDNTPCYGNVTNSSSVGSTCSVTSDCAPFEECNTTSSLCYFPPKQCKFDCNGLGDCIYKNTKTGALLDTCVRGDTTCTPRCDCHDGYAGETCQDSQAEADAKLKAREEMATALSAAVATEPLNTPNAVQDLIAMIEALSANPFELTVTACDSISSMVTLALAGVNSLDMAYEDLSAIYTTLDDCQTVYIENGLSISLNNRRRLESAGDINDLMSQYVLVISNGIEGGQDAISGVKNNFRTTNFFSSDTKFMAFDVAQTPAEVAVNAAKSSLTVDLGINGSGADVSTSIVESVYQMYETAGSNSSTNDALIGNPVRANFLRSTKSTMATVQFHLINAVEGVTYGQQLESNETFTTHCERGTHKLENFTCDSGYVLEHECRENTTTSSTVRSTCPSSTYLPLCGLIIGGRVYKENPDPNGNTSCSVVGYNNVSVVCECNVHIYDSDSSEGRRRLDAAGDSGSVEVVSMSSFVADGIVITTRNFDELTLEDVGSVWIIIAMVMTMWATGLVLVYMLGSAKYHSYLASDNKVGVAEDDEGFVDNNAKKEYILDFVDKIFPEVFIDSSWSWAGLKREVCSYHRHYILFTRTEKRTYRNRWVTCLQLLSLHTMVFWVMAVTFELQFPVDDGSCELETTQDSCLSEKSMFDSDRNVCSWSVSVGACEYREVTLNFRMLLIVILIMAVVQALFNIPIDVLFQDIIGAPLSEELYDVDELANAGEESEGVNGRTSYRMSALNAAKRKQADEPPTTVWARAKSWFHEKFHWEQTRLMSTAHVEMHDRVLLLGENSYSKHNLDVTQHAAENMQLVFDYPELVKFVGIQRDHLLEHDPGAVAEFDEKWSWNSGFNDTVRAGGCFKDKHLHELMKRDVDQSVELAEKMALRLHRATTDHIGLELMHLFVLDLLGHDTRAARIFIQKTEEDFRHINIVTRTMKNLAWATVIAFNLYFLIYMITLGVNRPRDFQISFVTACMIQLFFEIFVFETLEVAWVQYIIPMLVMDDVRKRIRFLRQQINDAFDVKLSCTTNPFDATEYLFASARLAKEFPSLFESEIILIFSNYLPGAMGERWKGGKWWRPSNMKGVRFSLLIPALAILQYIGTITMRVQKAIVRVFQPILWVLGIILAFFFVANPVWLVIPAAFIAFEGYQWYKRRRPPKTAIIEDLDDIKDEPLKAKPQPEVPIMEQFDERPVKAKPIEEHAEEPVVEPPRVLKKKKSTFAAYEIEDKKMEVEEEKKIEKEEEKKQEKPSTIDDPYVKVSAAALHGDDDDDMRTVFDDDGKPVGVKKISRSGPTDNAARKKKRKDRQKSHQLYNAFEERQKAKEVSGHVDDETSNGFMSPKKSMDPFRVAPVQRSISNVAPDDYVPSPYADRDFSHVDMRDIRPGRVHLPPVSRTRGPGSAPLIVPSAHDVKADDDAEVGSEKKKGGKSASATVDLNEEKKFTDFPNLNWEK